MFAFIVVLSLLGGVTAMPWSFRGYCADLDPSCSTSAWRNECLLNSEILRLCPESCGFCNNAYYKPKPDVWRRKGDYDCVDTVEDCKQYVDGGWCEFGAEFGQYVHTNCKKSCGVCDMFQI